MSGFSLGLKIKAPVEKKVVPKYASRTTPGIGLRFQRPGEPMSHFVRRAKLDYLNSKQRREYFNFIAKYPQGLPHEIEAAELAALDDEL